MTPIDLKRKELEKGCGIDTQYYKTNRFNIRRLDRIERCGVKRKLCSNCKSKLEGFNLGCQMQKEEFLDLIKKRKEEAVKNGYGYETLLKLEKEIYKWK